MLHRCRVVALAVFVMPLLTACVYYDPYYDEPVPVYASYSLGIGYGYGRLFHRPYYYPPYYRHPRPIYNGDHHHGPSRWQRWGRWHRYHDGPGGNDWHPWRGHDGRSRPDHREPPRGRVRTWYQSRFRAWQDGGGK